MVKIKIERKKFVIRKYKKSDEKRLLKVMNETFFRNETPEYFKWKYLDNPYGSLIIIIENDRGEIVGHMGHQIKNSLYDQKVYPLLNTCDMGIIKEYRGLGLSGKFYLLSPKTPHVRIGFPNSSAIYSYKKFDDDFNQRSRIIQLDLRIKKYNWFQRSIINFSSDAEYKINLASIDDEKKLNEFWNSKKDEYKDGVIRDYDYLKWRVFASPSNMSLYTIEYSNKIIGYFVLLIKEKAGYIVDVLILNEFMTRELFSRIEKIFIKNGASKIQIATNDVALLSILKTKKYKTTSLMNVLSYNRIERGKIFEPYLTLLDTDSL